MSKNAFISVLTQTFCLIALNNNKTINNKKKKEYDRIEYFTISIHISCQFMISFRF